MSLPNINDLLVTLDFANTKLTAEAAETIRTLYREVTVLEATLFELKQELRMAHDA